MKYTAYLSTGRTIDIEVRGALVGGDLRNVLTDVNGIIVRTEYLAALVPITAATPAPDVAAAIILDGEGDRWLLQSDGMYVLRGSESLPTTREEIERLYGIDHEL